MSLHVKSEKQNNYIPVKAGMKSMDCVHTKTEVNNEASNPKHAKRITLRELR